MIEPDGETPLSRTAASEAVLDIGWRFLLGTLCASVATDSLMHASEVAAAAVAAAEPRADDHLRIDMRPDRVELSLQTRALAVVTNRDTELAHAITGALGRLGLHPTAATSAESPRPVQMLELAIDALDIAAIRPFWKAVLAYADEPGRSGRKTPSSIPPASSQPSGFSKWMRRARSETGSISTLPSLTMRPRRACKRRWPLADGSSTIPSRGHTGSSPMRRGTKCVSAPGPTGTSRPSAPTGSTTQIG
jgi:4a-hydroxytetrahydrobiopterin dehydratase